MFLWTVILQRKKSLCAPNNHRKKLNKCKKYHRSSKRNFCSQRKEGSSSIWHSYFHYFFFMFHLPSCSKLLKKLSQLPIGLPAQSVRALPGKSPFFSPSSSIAHYKNPTPSPMIHLQTVYGVGSISTILQKNRGLRTVYRHTASCGSLSWPWCLTSTQFPLPLPTPHPGPCVIAHRGQTQEHAQCTRTRLPAAKISRAKI